MNCESCLSRRDVIKAGLATTAGVALGSLAGQRLVSTQTPGDRCPNVLFIAIDDLRPELGCYGNRMIQTPNIDRFSDTAATFEHAYCQQAVCGPSRTSMLTGLRPDTTGVTRNPVSFRETTPDAVTMPEVFKRHGYHTVSLGKIFHRTKDHQLEDELSWSEPAWRSSASNWLEPENLDMVKQQRKAFFRLRNSDQWEQMPWYKQAEARMRSQKAFPYEAGDVDDDAYADGQTASRAVEKLKGFASDPTKPFFLSVGFIRPHLPFSAPKRYWDMYDPADLPRTQVPDPPANAPAFAPKSKEINQYAGTPKDPNQDLDESLAEKLVHGYYAATSYVDVQVGRVLDALKQHGMQDNTIVVIWADHGWKLGDYGQWCKHTNYEFDTRAPMLIRAPGVTRPGSRISAMTEFVDLFPTLVSLAGLKLPQRTQLDGRDMTPLFSDPNAPWKQAAWSQYPKLKWMGYALRTQRYRFVAWVNPETGDVGPTELYDHRHDPLETVNVADDPKYAQAARQMLAMYHAGPGR